MIEQLAKKQDITRVHNMHTCIFRLAVRLVYCCYTIVQLDIVKLVVPQVHIGTTKGATYFTEYKIVIGEIFIN